MTGPTIGIVLPTIPGREHVFDCVYEAFEATCPDGWDFDIVIPEGYETVGEAWNAGATDLLSDFDGDYMFFAIDDCEPHPGWAEVAVQTADAGYVPAPRQEYTDGRLEMCGSMGFGAKLPEAPDGTPCRNTGIIFLRREWWETIGEFLPIHYGCDDDWCFRSAIHGHPVMYRSAMRFTHHDDATAAQHVRERAMQHHHEVLRHVTTLRYPGAAAAALADDPALTLTHYPR